jgi:thiol-disulfide isomerase/thioredoxin
MNKIFLLITLIGFSLLSGCKTLKPAAQSTSVMKITEPAANENNPVTVNYSEQITWVLGYFTPDRLTRAPHAEWYLKGKDSYVSGSEAVNKLLDINKDALTIKIVMGTWCPDSRREVPRFMRVMDIWQFPYSKITFIGVDDAKLSPVGEYEGLDIQRVPTFIIYKNNIEAGRIIENPKTSLEQDIVDILTRNE